MSNLVVADDLEGRRCRRQGDPKGFMYTVKAVWVVRDTLYCALITDDGLTNAGYWKELEFEPVVAKAAVDDSKLPPMYPIGDFGDLMEWKDFVKSVKAGDLSDDDGSATLATSSMMSGIDVEPSELHLFKRPDWATHVVWYNK